MAFVDPARQKYPAGHDPLHVALVSSEPTVPNVPFGHAVQFGEPLILYQPAWHCVAAPDPEGQKYPAGHRICVPFVAPATQ